MLDMFMATAAFAQDAAEESSAFSMIMGPIPMLVIMGAVFYFLLIRPQQKKNKEMKNMLENLRKGDEVVTRGGIYGRITGLSENQVIVEVAPQVRIKIHRPSISHVLAANSEVNVNHPDQNN